MDLRELDTSTNKKTLERRLPRDIPNKLIYDELTKLSVSSVNLINAGLVAQVQTENTISVVMTQISTFAANYILFVNYIYRRKHVKFLNQSAPSHTKVLFQTPPKKMVPC